MASERGSQELFERLVETYHDQVFHFFRRRGVGFEDSLDLTQDTFFRVFNHIDRLRADEAQTTWILTIAANRWKNWLRHRSAQKRAAPEISLDSLLDDAVEPQPAEGLSAGAGRPGDPLRGLLGRERVERVVEAIERLPPKQQRCLRLKVFQGRTYSEIAVLLGISEQTVKSHIHQARRRLAEEVAPELEGERKGDSDEP